MYINKQGVDYLLNTDRDVFVWTKMCGATKAVDIPITRRSGSPDEITVYSRDRACTIILDDEVYNIGDDGEDFERFVCNLQTVFALDRLGKSGKNIG